MSEILDEFLSVVDAAKAQSVEQVLSVILAKTRRYTMAEAGSVFLLNENGESQTTELIACSLQNDKVSVSTEMFTIPANNTSIAGYVASTGEAVEIDDLYELNSNEVPYSFNRSYDDKDGYKSHSMLAFPLKNYEGKVLGVVQLLNHINGVNADGMPSYKPFPASYIDELRTIMIVLSSIVEKVILTTELRHLKAVSGEITGMKIA